MIETQQEGGLKSTKVRRIDLDYGSKKTCSRFQDTMIGQIFMLSQHNGIIFNSQAICSVDFPTFYWGPSNFELTLNLHSILLEFRRNKTQTLNPKGLLPFSFSSLLPSSSTRNSRLSGPHNGVQMKLFLGKLLSNFLKYRQRKLLEAFALNWELKAFGIDLGTPSDLAFSSFLDRHGGGRGGKYSISSPIKTTG